MGLRPTAWEVQRRLVDKLLERWLEAPLRPLFVVVPSWLAAVQLRRRLAQASGGRGHVNVRFTTPAGLVEALGADTAARLGLRPLPPWGLELLARRAAAAAGGGLGAVAGRPGFARTLARTLQRLRLHGVAPERLLEQARRAADPEEAARWLELARMYAFVSSRLAPVGDGALPDADGGAPGSGTGLFADLAGLARLAVQAVRDGQAPGLLGSREVWLWGVDGALDGARLWAELVQALRDPASGLRTEQPEFLSPGLFPAPGPCEVRPAVAATELEEAELAVRELLAAAQSGVPLWRMAVVSRSPATYVPLVLAALERAGMPAFVAGGRSLAATPVGRAVTGWMRLVDGGLSRAGLLEWLSVAPVRPEWLKIPPQRLQPARWAMLSLRAGLAGDAPSWADRLRRWSTSGEAGETDLEDVYAFEAALRGIVAEAQAFPRSATWAEMADALSAWMGRALVAEGAFRAVQSRIDAMRVLDELESGPATPLPAWAAPGPPARQPVTVDMVREALDDLLSAPVPGDVRFEQGSVAVLGAEEALGCAFDVVVVPGVVLPHFPEPAPVDPVLGSEDLARLTGTRAADERVRFAERERLLFAWAVSSASKRAVVTMPRAEAASAREYAVSPFFEEVRDLATSSAGPPGKGDPALAGGAPDQGLDLALDACEWDLRLARSRRDAAAGFLAELYPHAAAGARARHSRRVEAPGVFDGILGFAAQLQAVSRDRREVQYSPTELEEYARCPRLYLFHRLLGIEADEEPEESMGLVGATRGRVVHGALRRFYGELEPSAPLPADWPQRLHRAVEEALQETGPGIGGPSGLVDVQARALAASLMRLVEADARRLPPAGVARRYVEQPFARLEVELEDGASLLLEGRIDRVDVGLAGQADGPLAGGQARVVDYKTGQPPRGRSGRIEGGLHLQAPVYLLAAAKLIGLPPEACRACLVYLDAPGLPLWVETGGEGWPEIAPLLRQALAVISAGMEAGYFAPHPHPSVRCETCRFFALCGTDARRLRDRMTGRRGQQARASPGWAAFSALEAMREAVP